ncbi:methionine/alanine import family NSS transporter small subunit [Fictibacillus iocasae]|uniref:Methionine/alanine import family NSS transporter small subunit n=1 Tax=Fictibacillus iocasae TaxID=2715437 RepID=A0ABW2NNR0_9BACL
MSASAIAMMLVGMGIIWGGLALSILNVVKVSKNK